MYYVPGLLHCKPNLIFMNQLLLMVVMLLGAQLFAQDKTVEQLKKDASRTVAKDPADTIQKVWKRGGLLSANLAQANLSNWAAGGDDFSLAVNAFIRGYAYYSKNRHNWDNVLDINLGYVRTTSLGGRKNDDRIDLLSRYGYALTPKTRLAGVFNFRSQFFNGFTYNKDSLGRAVATRTSDFLSPAYILLGAGLEFVPRTGLSLFVSPLTSRWVVVKDKELSAKGGYGVEPGRTVNNEVGAFASINYTQPIGKAITYTSRLDLFSNYRLNPQNIDVFMVNLLAVKLSKALSLTYNLDVIYDDDVRLFGPAKKSAATQLKSLVGIGFLVKR